MAGMTNDSEAFWRNGPAPGSFYNFPGSAKSAKSVHTKDAKAHTLSPMVTGTSVLGVKFEGGVMLAADMLGSYGSLAKLRNCQRLSRVNPTTVLGASGDFADFQFIQSLVEQRVIEENCLDDGFGFSPKSLHSWLTRVTYNRRSRFDPLWNTLIVGGLENGTPYLGYVDKIGVAFEAPAVATGYGSYIALPLMRDAVEKVGRPLKEEEARSLLERCLTVLFYRDARSFNKFQIATVTAAGAKVEGPFSAETNWSIANMISGYE